MSKYRIRKTVFLVASGAILLSVPLAQTDSFIESVSINKLDGGKLDRLGDRSIIKQRQHQAEDQVDPYPISPAEEAETAAGTYSSDQITAGNPARDNQVIHPRDDFSRKKAAADEEGTASNDIAPNSHEGVNGARSDEGKAVVPRTWTRELVSGDTLDGLLEKAGVAVAHRYELTKEISKSYDLAHLRPGVIIKVTKDGLGNLTSVNIIIDSSHRIEVTIGDDIQVAQVKAKTDLLEMAKEVIIEGSIYTSLQKAEVPTKFAVAIEKVLSGHLNFRRDLQAGDALEILWMEERTADAARLKGAELKYARLKSQGSDYDVIWEGQPTPVLLRDGSVIRKFSPPVPEARISSNYGMRRHPVLGGRRMHKGTDFAAPTGTPVLATAAGVVSYVGRRGAYGRVVEVRHSSSVTTRYAHLSKYGAKRGQRVEAGDRIGSVGASGRVTGAHLHYEFLLNGKAVNPMASGRWEGLTASKDQQQKIDLLSAFRNRYLSKA